MTDMFVVQTGNSFFAAINMVKADTRLVEGCLSVLKSVLKKQPKNTDNSLINIMRSISLLFPVQRSN